MNWKRNFNDVKNFSPALGLHMGTLESGGAWYNILKIIKKVDLLSF